MCPGKVKPFLGLDFASHYTEIIPIKKTNLCDFLRAFFGQENKGPCFTISIPPFFEGLATTAMKAVSAIEPCEGSVLSIGHRQTVSGYNRPTDEDSLQSPLGRISDQIQCSNHPVILAEKKC